MIVYSSIIIIRHAAEGRRTVLHMYLLQAYLVMCVSEDIEKRFTVGIKDT